jgi:fructose-1,6-bisphosphatase/inositol monophosphatase family enzyme
MKIDLQRVHRILAETASAVVLPRHRALRDADIRTKSGPGDLVTVADEEAEAMLSRQLTGLLPGSITVGEEATSSDDTTIRRLATSQDPIWIIDPIDGTWNFAHGTERFCMMVALSQRDRILAAWIYEPLKQRCTIAEHGSGCWQVTDDGHTARLTIPAPPTTRRGFVYHRHVDNAADERLGRWGSAGIEYLAMLKGEGHFSCYDRSMPWDHAPGSLVVSEAGGRHAFIDGGAYVPSGGPKRAVFAAARPEIWEAERERLIADPSRY